MPRKNDPGPRPSRSAPAGEQLAWYFARNGYVRRQDAGRLATEGAQAYKKGEEVRLTAESEAELRALLRLVRGAGLEPGRPFQKGERYRLPIYGRDQTARFLELVGARRPR